MTATLSRLAGRPAAAALAALSLASASIAGNNTSMLAVPAGTGKLYPPVPQPADRFGSAVAVSGQTVVVGGIGAWVFRSASPTGPLQFDQELHVPGSTPDFGAAVDIDGDVIAVTDLGEDEVGINATVRVFRRQAGSWNLEATLPPGGVVPFNGFGMSVAISGDRLAVAAPYSGTNHGLVHVFSRESGSWLEVQVLSAVNPQAGDRFGADVDLDGNTLVVGAPGTRAGVWVFRRQALPQFQLLNTFAEDGSVVPGAQPHNPNMTGFGETVAIDGNTILVGRPRDPLLGLNAGAASFFEENTGNWQFMGNSAASDGTPGEFFGQDIAISGQRALIGARYDQQIGAVYVMRRNTLGQWEEETKLVPADGDLFDQFGAAVALDGDRVALGAPQDNDVHSWAGAVYTFVAPPVFPVELNAFCSGDGGDGAGCTNCPCANNAPAGTLGGCLNSTGRSARLASLGRPSVGGDSLRMEIAGATNASFAILISGESLTPLNPLAACPAGSGVTSVALDGLRCVALGVLRHGTRATDANGEVGRTNEGWGPPSPPVGGLIAQGGFTAGQTRYYQAHYREDVLAICGTGMNTTNAVAVHVQP